MPDFRPVRIGEATLTLTTVEPPGTAQDVSCAIKAATVTPEAPDDEVVETFCGPITEPGTTTWTLDVELLQDWRTDGVSRFLHDHAGELLTFTLDMYGSAHTPTADEPAATGTVRAIHPSYGGTSGEYAEDELSLPIVGEPTFPVAATAEAPTSSRAGKAA